jgi:hypothetical protein
MATEQKNHHALPGRLGCRTLGRSAPKALNNAVLFNRNYHDNRNYQDDYRNNKNDHDMHTKREGK